MLRLVVVGVMTCRLTPPMAGVAVNFATQAVNTIWKMQSPAPAGGLTVSPDGKTILFTQTDRDRSAIYVQ